MTTEDRLLMLDVFFGLRVALAADGQHVILRGPPDAVDAATPMVALRKVEIVTFLVGAEKSPGDFDKWRTR